MDITLNELYEGKPTVIKGKTFYKTESYVKPFIDKLSEKTTDFRIHVQLPSQYTITEDGRLRTDDITYNRIYIEAVYPDKDMYENHDKVIGMVMGIDVRRPIVKFFSGALNSACTNLCVFNPSHLSTQDIEEGQPINFEPLNKIIELQDETRDMLIKMANDSFKNDVATRESLLGLWVDKSIMLQYPNEFQKVKIGADTVIKAYKSLFFDENSMYYQRGQTFNMYDVYNAFTQQITDERDKGKIFTLPEKTILAKSIIGY